MFLVETNLIGVRFKLAKLNALLQFDPPDRTQIFQVHLSFLKVFQKNLDPRLAVVLAVGHQVDAGTLKVLE
jgi:hypothetical protein